MIDLIVDEICEEMAQLIAESLNGGEFYNSKWYTDGQREAWLKAVRPWAQEIAEISEELESLRNDILVNAMSKHD